MVTVYNLVTDFISTERRKNKRLKRKLVSENRSQHVDSASFSLTVMNLKKDGRLTSMLRLDYNTWTGYICADGGEKIKRETEKKIGIRGQFAWRLDFVSTVINGGPGSWFVSARNPQPWFVSARNKE